MASQAKKHGIESLNYEEIAKAPNVKGMLSFLDVRPNELPNDMFVKKVEPSFQEEEIRSKS